MLQNFRLSMTGLHTWFGLVLGNVLMACFFFGSLAAFDRKDERWALPQTRFEARQRELGLGPVNARDATAASSAEAAPETVNA